MHHLRRTFLRNSSFGIGSLALANLLHQDRLLGAEASSIVQHHAPRIKRVIWLTMAGGPSHLETFDYKPELAKRHGENMPESMTKGQQLAQLQGQPLKCYGPQTKFKKFGQSGSEICELFPEIGSVVDDICFIRSMTTDAINHDPAHMFMNTGSQIAGRPSMGAWVLYGLGSESVDLPGFVVLTSLGKGGQNQPIAARQWSSGFLPSRYQGVHLRGKGEPVMYLGSPPGVGRQTQKSLVDTINALNDQRHQATADPEIATRIAQYEMAFQMQDSIPQLMDAAGKGRGLSICMVARSATVRLRRTVYSRGVWRNVECDSFSCITRTGTIMAASRTAWS